MQVLPRAMTASSGVRNELDDQELVPREEVESGSSLVFEESAWSLTHLYPTPSIM